MLSCSYASTSLPSESILTSSTHEASESIYFNNNSCPNLSTNTSQILTSPNLDDRDTNYDNWFMISNPSSQTVNPQASPTDYLQIASSTMPMINITTNLVTSTYTPSSNSASNIQTNLHQVKCRQQSTGKKTNNRDKPFKCYDKKCVDSGGFKRGDELTRHRKIHTGERKHVCSICSRAFGRSDHLTTHFRY